MALLKNAGKRKNTEGNPEKILRKIPLMNPWEESFKEFR